MAQKLETRPITAGARCSCYEYSWGQCAACLLAYPEVVRSPIPLVYRVIEGGDVCASCCQAASGLVRDGDLVEDPAHRQEVDDAIGHPAYCEAYRTGEPACEPTQSHRWEYVLCRWCEEPATRVGAGGAWTCEGCATRTA